jgi:hypothetical protein
LLLQNAVFADSKSGTGCFKMQYLLLQNAVFVDSKSGTGCFNIPYLLIQISDME